MEKKQSIKSSQVNPWVIFFFVTIGTLMVNIDSSIINVALPTLQRSFDAPISQVQWVITIYLLVITDILPFIGKLSDAKGRKKFFIWGVAVFILGSVLSAFATSLFILIASRAIQGIGGAMIMGNVMGIVANTFPQGKRGKALGTIGAVVAVGTIIGPALGGLLIDQFGWRFIFWINVPLGILSMVGTYYYMPSLIPESGKQKVKYDIGGSVLFFVATAILLYYLSNAGELGISSRTGSTAIGILLFNYGISRFHGNYDQAMNLAFTVSVVIGFITILLLTLGFKFKSGIKQ